MASDKITYYVETNNVMISKYHLSFLYVLVSWPIIYLLIFATQPEWIVGNKGYLSAFGNGGTGTPTTNGKSGLNNTLLSDTGRENILWVSFLFALLVGLLVFVFFYF